MTRAHLLFALMCLIWGVTWIAIKTGVGTIPPFFFATSRFLAAGVLLLALASKKGALKSPVGNLTRVVIAALLVNTACYGFLFWGMQHVSSGVSAVVNLSLIPVGLFSIGLLLREEAFSWRRLVAIVLGVFGVAVLFLPKLSAEEEMPALLGMLAIVAGTLAYSWGSILSRPLLRKFEPLSLSALHNLIGGAGLALLTFAFEPVGITTLRSFLTPPVLMSWLFLVLGGSVIAFTIYLSLLRDWGPTRAGLYAFLSPVVAVVLGVGIFGEPFGGFELTGSLIMLTAAALAMQKPAATRVEVTPQTLSARIEGMDTRS